MCTFMFGLLSSGTPAPRKLEVAGTNIFARGVGARQFLACGMNVTTEAPLAMVLPLPVPAGCSEDAVRFVGLQAYPDFFVDLKACIPPVIPPQARGGWGGSSGPVKTMLVVHQTGDFEASFVPTLADVDRLDPRFRVPAALWDSLPQYEDWGFAVFQLKNVAAPAPTGLKRWLGKPATKTVHPMAIDFPRRHVDRLFFPTVHIHDDALHVEDNYDHLLFWKNGASHPGTLDPKPPRGLGPMVSEEPVRGVVDMERAAGLVDGDLPLHCRSLQGRLPNRDYWLHAEQAE